MISLRNKTKRKKIFLIFYVVFLLLLLAAGLLLSPLFKVKTVEVYGTKEINPDEIKASIEYKNILFITGNGLKNELLKKFPQIAQLDIEKNIPKTTIKITLTERQKAGIICKTEQGENGEEIVKSCFYVDKLGVIFKNAPQTSGSLILLIKDFSLEDFSLGKKIFSEQIMNSIIELRDNIFSQINVRAMWFANFTSPPEEIKVMTSEGWYALFDLNRDIKSQLSILKAALAEKIKDRKKLEYIDLRIENRIYYK